MPWIVVGLKFDIVLQNLGWQSAEMIGPNAVHNIGLSCIQHQHEIAFTRIIN